MERRFVLSGRAYAVIAALAWGSLLLLGSCMFNGKLSEDALGLDSNSSSDQKTDRNGQADAKNEKDEGIHDSQPPDVRIPDLTPIDGPPPAQVCSNNIREGTEACDGEDFGGKNCGNQGFDFGELACKSDCTLDTSGCTECGSNSVGCNYTCCDSPALCLNDTICCPSDQVCAGKCCGPTDLCINSGCCPEVRACGSECCPTSATCVGDSCCPTAKACGSECCSSSETCLSNSCCLSTLVCGSECCSGTETCLNDTTCCPPDQVCNGQCCGSSDVCLNGGCCAADRVCGSSCCTGDQLCFNGTTCRLPSIGEIAFFLTTTTHNGNLGGRSGADSICANSRPAELNCAQLRAYLTTSASDDIASMPTHYPYSKLQPLYFYNRSLRRLTRFADNWAAALGSIDVSLKTGSGVSYFNAYDGFWSGSKTNGTFDSSYDYTCSGWTTSSSGAVLGTIGDAGGTSYWLHSSSNYIGCANDYYFLCACSMH